MAGDALFVIFFIASLLFSLVPIVFIGWFCVKFLKVQQEKNEILRTISDKLTK